MAPRRSGKVRVQGLQVADNNLAGAHADGGHHHLNTKTQPKRPENWNYKKSEDAKPRHIPDFKYREGGDSFFSTQVHPMGHNPPEDNIFGGTKN